MAKIISLIKKRDAKALSLIINNDNFDDALEMGIDNDLEWVVEEAMQMAEGII